MNSTVTNMIKHPLSVFYGTLLLILAIKGFMTELFSGAWDAAIVDLVMAIILILVMFRNACKIENPGAKNWERFTAWGLLVISNLLILLPESSFSGNLLRSMAFVLLLIAFVLHCSNWRIALHCLPATLWCCIFVPFHEEIMLMASYPLRLSATMLAAFILKICGTGVVYSGSSLHLPDLDIAITDACSGINQLDAFLLVAYIAVKMMHTKECWQVLHYAFIIPAVIIGNSLRIVLTVVLFKICGEVILGKGWHVALGYVQIIIALLVFIVIGKLFSGKPEKKPEDNL